MRNAVAAQVHTEQLGAHVQRWRVVSLRATSVLLVVLFRLPGLLEVRRLGAR